MVDTILDVQWTEISPNLKRDIGNEGGHCIADPYFILRAGLFPSTDETEFNVFTPAVTGRLERVIFIPDHDDPPGVAGSFDLDMFQHYIEAPKIDAGDTPLDDTLDILNGLGAVVPNNAITHLTAWGDPPYPVAVRTPLLPHLLVHDKIRMHFTNWSDGTLGQRILFIYLYFSTGSPFAQPIVPA